ncbi:hypothetical protein GGD67_002732 [Bradyrhizobium sp. IAR9]|uniref:hypothetical protein n=1 Tax=Bradyrhizobium sp. IAR9 TaxID=2663841 RepID=UPI0015C8962A|nr:hypothetical protein [Bradyrhizobium sp. IAR9]NYG45274.1 hypothetical protein [Bradyrhizobium sp. IAR9]
MRVETGIPLGSDIHTIVLDKFDILDGLGSSADATDQLFLVPNVETVADYGRSIFLDSHRDGAIIGVEDAAAVIRRLVGDGGLAPYWVGAIFQAP